MFVKRCAICKRPSFIAGKDKTGRKWLCPSCKAKFDQTVMSGAELQGGKICRKCRQNSRGECRFSPAERAKITACSDWDSKDAEHEKRRWAKYETDEKQN